MSAVSIDTAIAFDNSYARLPEGFFKRVTPAMAPAPRLIKLNHALATDLGLDAAALDSPGGARLFSGAQLPEGAEPIALAYAGHQFGHFVPQLGDGRAVLLGEVVDRQGRRRDIQLKGSGRTPFSRGGDGRAALGPVLREYLVSEAMAALGIPTTRALAAVATGDEVARERLLPGAVLTRVASSHIRVGSFQFFAARGDTASLRQLAEHAIARHYRHVVEAPEPFAAFLQEVSAAQGRLVAQWMLVGFVHGVMNTDNMSIAGETIDYGPCAFLDTFDPATVFSSIDQGGRYAYGNQPAVAQWNLTRLAECLLPLLSQDDDEAVETAQRALGGFAIAFNETYAAGLGAKLGLSTAREGDLELARDLLECMRANRADFTATFRRLGEAAHDEAALARAAELFDEPGFFLDWAARWRRRLAEEPMPEEDRERAMARVNPAVVPRNAHVEAAIAAAVEHGDFQPFEALNAVLARPFEDRPDAATLAAVPPKDGPAYRTFCGT